MRAEPDLLPVSSSILLINPVAAQSTSKQVFGE
jgi:hypothetical protein